MKGVIIVGETGSNLYPLTKLINKHVLPVYDRPLIYYPIEVMATAGIKEILLVLSGSMAEDCVSLLGSGEEFGVRLTYKFYEPTENLVELLWQGREFVNDEGFMVIKGDNVIIGGDLETPVQDFVQSPARAGIFLKEVPYSERYGAVEIKDGKIMSIQEKGISVSSNYAVTGIFLYKPDVFKIIEQLRKVITRDLDIFGLNNYYIQEGLLCTYYLKGHCIHVKRFESLFKAALVAREEQRKNDG